MAVPAIAHVRPSGPLRWILPRLNASDHWTMIGSLSAEDRCLAAVHAAAAITKDLDVILLRIEPDTRTKWPEWLTENRLKTEANAGLAENAFGKQSIRPAGSIQDIDHDISILADDITGRCEGDVVLDVSTMPKRFFFTVMTKLARSKKVRTLIATNTSPKAYGKELARDPDHWRQLPIYCGDSDLNDEAPKSITATPLIIGVGYHTLNIREILGRAPNRRFGIKLFLPFPSLHPGFTENWKFIHSIRSEWDRQVSEPIEIVRTPINDVSVTFDRLLQYSNQGTAASLVLAPFGPKTLSLAMCLLGIARFDLGISTEIGYTQPRVYSPNYSSGSGDVTAFCIKLNGQSLYALEPNSGTTHPGDVS